MEMEAYYRTRDLAVASFLYASGKKLVNLDRQNNRVWFVFKDAVACEKLVNSFWGKDALVNAKEFADSLRRLKDLIFNK